MPNWTTTPPTTDEHHAFRILRTPTDQSFEAIVTAVEIAGTYTHYVSNRTIPCEGPPDCEHCQEGHSFRWHGYLSCIVPKTYEHCIFEFTKIPGKTFANYRQIHQEMRGCHFRSSRPSKRINGRVIISCKQYDANRYSLPKPPNIRQILCHIWNVQYKNTIQQYDPEHLAQQVIAAPNKRDGRYRSGSRAK